MSVAWMETNAHVQATFTETNLSLNDNYTDQKDQETDIY